MYSAIINGSCAFSIAERFQKQTLRSRTQIITSQGPMSLSVPVIRPQGKQTLMTDVLVSYEENWQKDHFKSIESAYRSSPFFEFFMDELTKFYNTKFHRLIELNQASHQMVFQWLQCQELAIVDDQEAVWSQIAAKKTDYQSPEYWQVFKDTIGFYHNASILDLLCCEGPYGLELLRS